MTTYREYYNACRAGYPGTSAAIGVYRLGVHPQRPDQPWRPLGPADRPLLDLDDDYLGAVRELAAEVDRRLERRIGLFGAADAQVRQLALQLDEFWDIEALETIARLLVPQLEERVLGCHGLVNQVNLIRSLPDAAAAASSWLWHYDDNPDEAFKVLVYLTDVAADGGAFEYLRSPATGRVVKVSSSRLAPDRRVAQRWPGSRVPADEIERQRLRGFVPHRAVGPAGTAIVFDNNCVHRATVPAGRHRDAVIFNLRPCHRRVRPFVSERHTGSWSFNAKQWDPACIDIRPAA